MDTFMQREFRPSVRVRGNLFSYFPRAKCNLYNLTREVSFLFFFEIFKIIFREEFLEKSSLFVCTHLLNIYIILFFRFT